MSEHFARLRASLDQAPSPAAWSEIIALFGTWSDTEEATLGLDYATQHMAHWPDELRVWDHLAPHHPAWPLARAIVLEDTEREDLSFLSTTPQLTKLHMDASISLNDLEGLRFVPQLQDLCISLFGCEDMPDLEFLTWLPALTTLELQDAQYQTDMGAISELQALEDLTFLDFGLDDDGAYDIEVLGKLPRLRRLEIGVSDAAYGPIDLQNPSAFRHCKALEDLNLNHVEGLSDLKPLQKLPLRTLLLLEGTETVEGIEQLTQLRELIIQGCDDITTLAPFHPLQHLRTLDLSLNDNFLDADGRELSSRLKQLDISYNHNLSHVRHLDALPGLKRLNLARCEQLTTLEGFPWLSELEQLDLSDCSSLPEEWQNEFTGEALHTFLSEQRKLAPASQDKYNT